MLTCLVTVAIAGTLDEPTLFGAADPDRIEADLRLLTGAEPLDGAPIVSRNIHHPDIDRVAPWLQARLEEIDGLKVWTEPVEAEGEEDLYNVIAELPGQEELPPVLLTAHYDSIASLDEDWLDPMTQPAPGADDDASGVCAVMEAARQLSAWSPGFRRPIRFVLFTAEEEGLVGSERHVEGLIEAGESVEIAYVLDPVGYDPGDAGYLWFSHNDASAAAGEAFEALAASLEASQLQVYGVHEDLIGGDVRSDHAPFWAAGFLALHIGTFPQPPTYHTMGDDLDVVDLSFVRDVSGLGAVAAARAAEPLPEPEPGRCQTGGGEAAWPWLAALWLRRRR